MVLSINPIGDGEIASINEFLGGMNKGLMCISGIDRDLFNYTLTQLEKEERTLSFVDPSSIYPHGWFSWGRTGYPISRWSRVNGVVKSLYEES